MELRKKATIYRKLVKSSVLTLWKQNSQKIHTTCVCGEVMPKDGVHVTYNSHFKGNKRNFILSQMYDHSLGLWLYLITAHVTGWKAEQELF